MDENVFYPSMVAAEMPFSMKEVTPLCPDAQRLLTAFRAEMLGRYSDLIGPSGPPPPEPGLGPRSSCLLVSCAEMPVACGALRQLETDIAELKRVYVVPEFRRRGLARRLLAALEQRAADLGFRLIRLETGKRQPEAVALYEASGYRRIPPFGRHAGDPMSVCFEKALIS